MLALGLGAFLIWHNRPPSWQRGTAASVGLSSAFAMIAGAILVFGVHAETMVFESESPIEPTEDSLRIGREIFMDRCLQCHGATGEGGPLADTLAGGPPPRLGDHVPFHNDGTLFTWISDGIPADEEQKRMPSFEAELTEEERWHVVNYLRKTWTFGFYEPVLPEDLQTPEADPP